MTDIRRRVDAILERLKEAQDVAFAQDMGLLWHSDDCAEAIELLKSLADRPAVMTPGWIVANGNQDRFRFVGSFGNPDWTTDKNLALRFARRRDAEEYCREDEDAWAILPIDMPPARDRQAGFDECLAVIKKFQDGETRSVQECARQMIPDAQRYQYAAALLEVIWRQLDAAKDRPNEKAGA